MIGTGTNIREFIKEEIPLVIKEHRLYISEYEKYDSKPTLFYLEYRSPNCVENNTPYNSPCFIVMELQPGHNEVFSTWGHWDDSLYVEDNLIKGADAYAKEFYAEFIKIHKGMTAQQKIKKAPHSPLELLSWVDAIPSFRDLKEVYHPPIDIDKIEEE